MVKMYSLTFVRQKCVVTLRDAFFGVFLNGTRFFIYNKKIKIYMSIFNIYQVTYIGAYFPIITICAAKNYNQET